jgi:hypothetical protein
MMIGVRIVAVLLAASFAVPLAAWRLAFLRPAPFRFWALHPRITALACALTTPELGVALASRPRASVLVVVLLTAIGLEFLIIAVSIVHGLRGAWKRSRRRAALIIVVLLLMGILIAALNPGVAGVFRWMVAAMVAVVWCVLMAIGAEFLERRYPE